MIGAILGDIIGSPYEFGPKCKQKEFPLFINKSKFTDDSVMTIAIADALLQVKNKNIEINTALIRSMQKWGHKYPYAGYGRMFRMWLKSEYPQPYYSFGNGSAMRVSPVGWLYDSFEDTWKIAKITAEITHNHPEGIKGAECIACIIWLARNKKTKEEIHTFVESTFGYDLSRTCDQIRPTYQFNETCQGTVPEAITAFLEGNSFEDVIRTAVSLGGDCDTLTCIAGSMAEAYYGIPDELQKECIRRVPKDMQIIINQFLEERK